MPKKRLPKGQKSLLSPEAEAHTEFKEDMGKLVFNMEVVCPFCAWRGRVIQFRTKKSERSKSFSTKMFKCPDCGQGMRRDTLFRDFTVSEWARWLYTDVIMFKGYHRISFPKLLQRLKEYGWANEFWSAWKAVKDNRTTSDVEDYLDYKRGYEEELEAKQQVFEVEHVCPMDGKEYINMCMEFDCDYNEGGRCTGTPLNMPEAFRK